MQSWALLVLHVHLHKMQLLPSQFRRVQGVPLSHSDTTRLPAGPSTRKVLLLLPFSREKTLLQSDEGSAALLPGGQNFATAFKSRQCENSRFPFLEKQTLACLGNNPQSFPAASMPGVGCVAVPVLMNMKSRALPTAFECE